MTKYVDLDVRESGVLPNDIVLLSAGGPEWRVTKVKATDIYLKSVKGGRFGVETVNRVCSVSRDVHFRQEPDWTSLYGEEEAGVRYFVIFQSSGTTEAIKCDRVNFGSEGWVLFKQADNFIAAALPPGFDGYFIEVTEDEYLSGTEDNAVR